MCWMLDVKYETVKELAGFRLQAFEPLKGTLSWSRQKLSPVFKYLWKNGVFQLSKGLARSLTGYQKILLSWWFLGKPIEASFLNSVLPWAISHRLCTVTVI